MLDKIEKFCLLSHPMGWQHVAHCGLGKSCSSGRNKQRNHGLRDQMANSWPRPPAVVVDTKNRANSMIVPGLAAPQKCHAAANSKGAGKARTNQPSKSGIGMLQTPQVTILHSRSLPVPPRTFCHREVRSTHAPNDEETAGQYS